MAGRSFGMKIAAMAVARRLTGLHPVGSSNSDKFVFFFSCQNWIVVRHRVFFFFFQFWSGDHP